MVQAVSKRESEQERKSTITLLTFQVMDLFLSKTAYIKISKHLARRGNHVEIFAIRSNNVYCSRNPGMKLLLVPLRVFPFVTHILYVMMLVIFLPFYTMIRRPEFVITEPRFGSSLFILELKLLPSSLGPKTILDIRSTPVEVHNLRHSLGAYAFNVSVATARKTFDGITTATEQMKKEICRKLHACMTKRLSRVSLTTDLFL